MSAPAPKRAVVQVVDSASRIAGGMFGSVRGLARGVSAGGAWRVAAVCLEDRYSEADRGAWEGLALSLAPRPGPTPFGAVEEMRKRIGATAPHLVHVHGVWGLGGLSALRVIGGGASQQPRLVVSPRGMLDGWALAQHRFKKTIARKLWVDRLLRRADCLHALCAAEAASVASVAPGRPICVIPNGVDLPASDPADAPPRDKSALFLGRLHPKKGLVELLDGWARSGLGADGWRLDIAGWDDGGHEASLRTQAARLGIDGHVRFLGPVFGADKAQLLASAEAFVLPSYSEGLPMAVLEAWSHATPVLMTGACNLPEGFVVGAAERCAPTPESVAEGLTALFVHRDANARRVMGASGRALVEARFTWPRVGAQMAAVYNWIAVGGSTPESVRPGACGSTDRRVRTARR